MDYVCMKTKKQDEEGRTRTAYRFIVLNGTGETLVSVDDVCSSESRARRLEDLFRRNQVAPVHVLEVLEDYLTI